MKGVLEVITPPIIAIVCVLLAIAQALGFTAYDFGLFVWGQLRVTVGVAALFILAIAIVVDYYVE